jgi:6-pyruvoyltetrahydropterin/6-carboxytetrahydropterin synthase
MKIFFEDTFDSAHWLPNVPANHKCSNLHGHTYKIRIEIEGYVNSVSGWVVDYADVKAKWLELKLILDHKCINNISGLENSTSENIAEWVYQRMSSTLKVSRVELRETEHCGAIREA